MIAPADRARIARVILTELRDVNSSIDPSGRKLLTHLVTPRLKYLRVDSNESDAQPVWVVLERETPQRHSLIVFHEETRQFSVIVRSEGRDERRHRCDSFVGALQHL